MEKIEIFWKKIKSLSWRILYDVLDNVKNKRVENIGLELSRK